VHNDIIVHAHQLYRSEVRLYGRLTQTVKLFMIFAHTDTMKTTTT